MEKVIDRTTEWLTHMILSSILATPLLLLLKVLLFKLVPWVLVFLPLLCTFHILLCWFSGRIIAQILLTLFSWEGGA